MANFYKAHARQKMKKVTLTLFFVGVVTAALTACAGVTDTRLAPAPGRQPVTTLLVLVDKDVIHSAFAAYRGSIPFGAKTGDYQGFIDNLVKGIQSEAAIAGVDASVSVVSLRALQGAPPIASRGKPVLTIRALSYVTRKETVSGRDLGWSGGTSWEFSLSEKNGSAPYARTWVAGIKIENLNPALCGSYDSCSKDLAQRIFAQMRSDGIVR
jgi:hypothetical protein